MNELARETLQKQLQLLSERSQGIDVSIQELVALSEPMATIFDVLNRY